MSGTTLPKVSPRSLFQSLSNRRTACAAARTFEPVCRDHFDRFRLNTQGARLRRKGIALRAGLP